MATVGGSRHDKDSGYRSGAQRREQREISAKGLIWLVGVARFELATPTSRTWCATRLRYTP